MYWKYFITIVLISFAPNCFSQQNNSANNHRDYQQLIKDIKVRDSLLNSRIDSIRLEKRTLEMSFGLKESAIYDTISKVNGRIDDGRLQKALNVAENTLNKQNLWINNYGVIFTVFAIILAILTILLYLLQIRPLIQDAKETANNAKAVIKESNSAIQKLNERIINLDKIIEDRVQELQERYQQKMKSIEIDQILDYLTSYDAILRDMSIAKLNLYKKKEFNESQIYKLFGILNQYIKYTPLEEAIIYFLTKSEQDE